MQIWGLGGVLGKMMKNKRADIGITILVFAVIALCALALLSFYYVDKKQKSGGIDSVGYLQNIYNEAESIKFSGEGLVDKYEGAELLGDKFVIEKEFLDGDLKIKYIFDK